jgi:transposase
MLDETIVTETPPLYNAYGRVGEQTQVPITGNRSKRVLHGALNIYSGSVALMISEKWDRDSHMAFLRIIRKQWRGWEILLFEDQGSPHTASTSLELAEDLAIKIRFLPKAVPELNAMDTLWRHVKANALSNRQTEDIDLSADQACQYILDLDPRARLQMAGVLSGNFWLT